MALVALIVFMGSTVIERIISVWSIIFYATYLTLFFMVVSRFGGEMGAAPSISRPSRCPRRCGAASLIPATTSS